MLKVAKCPAQKGGKCTAVEKGIGGRECTTQEGTLKGHLLSCDPALEGRHITVLGPIFGVDKSPVLVVPPYISSGIH